MTDSTHRAIRTAIQVIFGVLAALAIILPLAVSTVPALVGAAGIVVAVSAAASKAWASAEAAGIIPAWLRGSDDSPVITARVNEALAAIADTKGH